MKTEVWFTALIQEVGIDAGKVFDGHDASNLYPKKRADDEWVVKPHAGHSDVLHSDDNASLTFRDEDFDAPDSGSEPTSSWDPSTTFSPTLCT